MYFSKYITNCIYCPHNNDMTHYPILKAMFRLLPYQLYSFKVLSQTLETKALVRTR